MDHLVRTGFQLISFPFHHLIFEPPLCPSIEHPNVTPTFCHSAFLRVLVCNHRMHHATRTASCVRNCAGKVLFDRRYQARVLEWHTWLHFHIVRTYSPPLQRFLEVWFGAPYVNVFATMYPICLQLQRIASQLPRNCLPWMQHLPAPIFPGLLQVLHFQIRPYLGLRL